MPTPTMTVTAVPLTRAAFEPYGQVLEGTEPGEHRHVFAARIVNDRPHARLNTVYMKAPAVTPTYVIPFLERHRHSNQAFVPMNGTRNLICVCPSDGEGKPIVSKLLAFVASGGQAFNIDPMVWHSPRQPVSEPGEMVMLRWDDGSAEDTEVLKIADAIEITGAV